MFCDENNNNGICHCRKKCLLLNLFKYYLFHCGKGKQMYCLLQIQSSLMKKPHWIEKKQYNKIVYTLNKSSDLLDGIELFSFFTETYEELINWCMSTDTGVEYLLTNKHTAERKCRGLLLELKIYLLQMRSKLVRKYGEDSAIYKIFENAKDDAKRKDIAFSLALDMKECANHCNEIVHSFVSPHKKAYLQPCCSPTTLLSDFDGWSKRNRSYLSSLNNNIDLLYLFESVYEVLKKIQKQLIEYILGTDYLKNGLLELRAFMDSYFMKENCTYFHLAHMIDQNGKDAPKMAFYQKKVVVRFEVFPVDWKVMYELTDLLRK